MLKKIKLLGHLGKKFGREYQFDVSSPAEAVKALCHQVKGFRQYMQEGRGKEQKFKIIVGDSALENVEKQLFLRTNNDISIVPIVKGSGGDVGLIILGAALVVASGGLGAGLASGLFVGEFAAFAGAASAATAIGFGVLAVGLSGLLFKPQTQATPQERNKNDDRSYLFNGAVNTTQQGQPIPIGYGRMRIGSQVVSASLSTAQVPI